MSLLPSLHLDELAILRVLRSVMQTNPATRQEGDFSFAEESKNVQTFTQALSLAPPLTLAEAARKTLALNACVFFGIAPKDRAELVASLIALPTLSLWAVHMCSVWKKSLQRLNFQTSGSTGTPEQHCYQLAMLEEETAALLPYFTDRKRVVCVVPVHHTYGMIFCLLLPQALGIPVIILPPLTVANFFENLRSGDLIVAFPVFWQAVLKEVTDSHLMDSQCVLPPDVWGISATAPCPAELIKALLPQDPHSATPQPNTLARMVEIYGATETGAIGIRESCDVPYSLLSIWNPETGPAGALHGICRVRRNGEVSPAQALPDIVRRVGERGFVPERRKDKAVQVGGVNVYPEHVAAIIRTHPAVKECAVRLMRPEEGSRLKLFIVPHEVSLVSAYLSKNTEYDNTFGRIFRRWLTERLKIAELPKSIRVGATLPRTDVGKLCDWNCR